VFSHLRSPRRSRPTARRIARPRVDVEPPGRNAVLIDEPIIIGGHMTVPSWRRAIALLAVTAFLSTGCASLQPVALAHSGDRIERPSVNVGESVVVKTTSGQTRKFTVTAVEDDALVGAGVRVPYAEMASLDVSRQGEHKMKTGVIVGIVVGVAALALALGGGGGGGGSGY
jgi:hypothetical protein